MDGDPARTKGKGLDGKHVARVDFDGSEVSRKGNRGDLFVAVPPVPRWIGQRAKGAPNHIGTLNRLHEQIVPKYDYWVHVVILSVVVKNFGRFAPINIRCNRPASDSVKVRRRRGHPFGKVDGGAVRVDAPMAIAVRTRRGWNSG